MRLSVPSATSTSLPDLMKDQLSSSGQNSCYGVSILLFQDRSHSPSGCSMLEKLIAPVAGLLDKFIEDKDQKNTLAHEIATMAERHAQELAKAQIEVNKAEASNPSLFVSVAGGHLSVGPVDQPYSGTSSDYPLPYSYSPCLLQTFQTYQNLRWILYSQS